MDEISLPHQVILCLLQEDDMMLIDSDTDLDLEEDLEGLELSAAAAEVEPTAEVKPAGSSLPKMTAVKQVPALKPDTVQAAPACPKAAEVAADMEWKRKYEELLAQVNAQKAASSGFNSPILQKVAFSPPPPPAAPKAAPTVSHGSPEELAAAKAKAPSPLPEGTSATSTSPTGTSPTSTSPAGSPQESAPPAAVPASEVPGEVTAAEAALAEALDMSAPDTCLNKKYIWNS